MMQVKRRTHLVGVMLSMMMALFGTLCACSTQVTELASDSRPLPPKPRALPEAPAGTTADAIVLQVAAKPHDVNGNHYPDTIEVLANLFSSDHPAPIYEDGEFVFALYADGRYEDDRAEPIREWRIGGARLERARIGHTIYGLTYRFGLSLLEAGSDRFPLMLVDLTCRFEPADGRPPIVRREIHKMQIGAN